MPETAKPVQLRPQTVETFNTYIREVEAAREQSLAPTVPFLWAEMDAARAQRVRSGEIVAQFWSVHGIKVPNG